VSSKSQTSRVGELVGEKYRILRVIAEGGMGVVYEAQHAVVKRRFAVKFLRTDLADRRDLLTRFHREAQAAGALESENIAAAIDFGIIPDGTPYIVMEHLVGESLGSLLAREGCLPVERAVDLCLQACRGMQAAHAAGIVHRDLKPENLFLCRREDGTDLVKVLDFGIAKLEQIELNSAATRTGTILGTPAYMSPEQARGDKSIDHRTDVYGLAAILFEMLSGKKPHPGDSHNAILHHIATQPAVSLHSVQPDLPAPLVDTVERALSCNRDQRHASVEELALALAPFAKREAWPPSKNADIIPAVAVANADAWLAVSRFRCRHCPCLRTAVAAVQPPAENSRDQRRTGCDGCYRDDDGSENDPTSKRDSDGTRVRAPPHPAHSDQLPWARAGATLHAASPCAAA
jgi:serine/threonine protein kinase